MFRESGEAVPASRSGLKLVPGHERAGGADGCGFGHTALLYGDLDEYLAGTGQFLRDGDAAGEALMVAIPGERVEPLREALGDAAERVRFLDMRDLGRNPARIIPKVRNWAELQAAPGCRFIGEPFWPGRDEPEVVEATRHEALTNLAFADLELSVLCPYDVNELEPSVLEGAERTHPQLLRRADARASDLYTDPLEIWLASQWALPEPDQTMATLGLSEDLAAARQITEGCAREAGLSSSGVLDLVLAVDEAATNAVVHGRPPAELRIWREAAGIVCEVTDHGRLEDPLAGRRFPAPDWTAGRGLWLINQLCDLVELRPAADGTAIRMHAHSHR
jgi:anti-sigma regulatory factor (Ser/Thr protein kinase)